MCQANQQHIKERQVCRHGSLAKVAIRRSRQQDVDTYRVQDTTKVHLRAAVDTFPIPPEAIPPIIDPEQFARVQGKLDALKADSVRGGYSRDDATTLLDHGLVRCANCGGRLTRWWDKRGKRPYYACVKRSGMPNHECAPHQIDATKTDAYALRLLAYSLTDPEKMLEIAEAAEQSYAEAGMDAALAASALAHATEQLAKNTAEQENLRTALAALSNVAGMEQQIAGIRQNQARLMAERAQLEQQQSQATPQHNHAIARQDFLRGLFTARDSLINPQTGEHGEEGEPHLHFPGVITLEQAAAWLEVSAEEVYEQADLQNFPVFDHTPYEMLGIFEQAYAQFGVPFDVDKTAALLGVPAEQAHLRRDSSMGDSPTRITGACHKRPRCDLLSIA